MSLHISPSRSFLTNESFEVKSHSEHFSALLALFYLEPTRPYERLLPPPFDGAWLQLQQQDPQQQLVLLQQHQQQQRMQQKARGQQQKKCRARVEGGSQTCGNVDADTRQSLASSSAEIPDAARTDSQTTDAVLPNGLCLAGTEVKIGEQKEHGAAVSSGGDQSLAVEPSSITTRTAVATPASDSGLIKITSAHRFASVYHLQQEMIQRRGAELRSEKERQLRELELQQQLPTVFMAEAVRARVRSLLKQVLVARQQGLGKRGLAAALLAARDCREALLCEQVLFPPQWEEAEWLATASAAFRDHRGEGGTASDEARLQKKLVTHLVDVFQLPKALASLSASCCTRAVAGYRQRVLPSAVAVIARGTVTDEQQAHTAVFSLLLESCIDFICINVQAERELPPAFNPCGKQIEVRCPDAASSRRGATPPLSKLQCAEATMRDHAQHFARALSALSAGEALCCSAETLSFLSLRRCLEDVTRRTGLFAVAAAALEAAMSASPCYESALIKALTAVDVAACALVEFPQQPLDATRLDEFGERLRGRKAVKERFEEVSSHQLSFC